MLQPIQRSNDLIKTRMSYLKFEPAVLIAEANTLAMGIGFLFFIRTNSPEAILIPLVMGLLCIAGYFAFKRRHPLARPLMISVSAFVFISVFLKYFGVKAPSYPILGMLCPPVFFGLIQKETKTVITPAYGAIIASTPEIRPAPPISPKALLWIGIGTAAVIGLLGL